MTNSYQGCNSAALATAKIETFNSYLNQYVSKRFFNDSNDALRELLHRRNHKCDDWDKDKFYLKDMSNKKWVEIEVAE